MRKYDKKKTVQTGEILSLDLKFKLIKLPLIQLVQECGRYSFPVSTGTVILTQADNKNIE